MAGRRRSSKAHPPARRGGRVKVALYHPWVYLTSGVERTFVELLKRSRHDWVIYTHHYSPSTTYPELRDADIRVLDPPVTVRRSFVPLVMAARRIWTTRLPTDAGAALLVSSEGLGDFIVNRAPMPAVCFCHTPLKILHDEASRAALREASTTKYAALRVLGPAFSYADRRAWRRYRHVFANSQETRRRIATARLADAASVEVLQPGVDLSRFGDSPQVGPREQFFLVAGRIMWQKNIELAVDAVRDARDAGNELQLVVAGAVDEKSKPYISALRKRAAGLPVTFEPNPTDDRLTQLYLSASALLFTARNEDWGMVPLEAMAAGCPVIAVDAGGPRESVVDGVTGWLVQPDRQAFAQRMVGVATASADDLRRLRDAARDRATAFGWDAFVHRIDDVMQAAAERGSRAPGR